ncbi:cytochrome P450 4C1-like [Pectinophora gossypiella]|uniref:cytochrome P450 4C1-like n=1 Tax=Pectinophora gossypiella TaxID=13191 RepID=UPI00214E87D6|nr:cytochrome P450 4C1-like [Pectinophora gossypiella]
MTSMWIGHLLFVVIADPVVGETVLKTYLEKSVIMRFVREIIGNGSIFAPVPIWRPRRKILAPTFSPKNLTQFVDIFAKQSSIMTDFLKPRVGNGPFSIWHYFTTYSMDSVCESTLGVKVDAQNNHNHQFLKSFDEGAQLMAKRVIRPWLHSSVIYQLLPSYHSLQKCKRYIEGFIDDVCFDILIQKYKRENFKTFLELLMESSGGERGYSNDELREETTVLVMAGTDTSAVGAAFTTLMMSRHPDIQEKVYEELKEVFGDSTREVTPEDLSRLKYLDAVIRESLRLYPPVPMIVRHCEHDMMLPSGVELVKGCVLLVSIWALHRNPAYWGADAEQFRPERFLTPLMHPAQFMPFSYGPRNCLGYQYAMMSMKTAMATLLRRYRVLPDSDHHKPLRVKFNIMMKDVDNFTVRLENRNVM